MARSDFFRNIPFDLAEELEALSRIQFELRESLKAILHEHKADSAQALCLQALKADDASLGEVAVQAAVLNHEYEAVHTELKSHLSAGTQPVQSVHTQIGQVVQAQCAQRYPGGATRRLDALELLDTDGIARVLRVASADCWFVEWGEDASCAQKLLRLPRAQRLYGLREGVWQHLAPDAAVSGLLQVSEIEELAKQLVEVDSF